ncbi:cysteine--1-D-myo-inosityl 2-amino-2-deoxy-alpha-D-glucopyranoside ligase [Aeromicrobium wangtongii]|uniref:L-cysteine:1D-myo-inositol 2-amino-2-deoxy-alpha-D-glucopyranoside ligase n=1 Tax=Aeromicrobium wangtongii TaxID=2969247 RepID=A0ABY5M527_9ACTN|nr:cysteine--1-D-myo-inosityl 2-amino-2-deoxy-alpha-D-glucopyranoside ligase [Aeromicrobium wangtongii]MCD9198032.1 cysteine--1-D-myo-inosityl 2-amino-2-deoxy-alpha-D-glucopyranoside ligase [Aeromicrobium wangtongii]UUP12074.1 cysteine--1-D-myo-inosityl 2-amino-2-deoxy-alpha-D-glucopyranoside ligase [Aeromicrobium wangtongii]
MRSWSSPEIPSLDDLGLGRGPAVTVHDTSSAAAVALDPDGHARMYVCGITPYDATHMGHAATYLAFDLLQRTWRDRGLDVTYTQNVTDVDDPLLERATATGVDWVELAERETQLFREDMTALRIIPPAHYIGAVESIDLVVDLVQRLQETDAVYTVDDDLYFDVHADPGFGLVSGFDEATMLKIFPERGGDPDRPGKKHPLDCLLWQAERPGEPAWDTRLGRGRPGWHIECAAIALHHLGTAFDVQGGGSDLVFPHHEMSASEATVATHEPFARAYVHAGMVGYEGEKMSKSKGNLVLVSKLRAAGHDPMAIRLALLAHHYRSDWEWFGDEIEAAEARLARWRDAVTRLLAPSGEALLAQIRAAMTNDLDAPAALAAIDAWAADDTAQDPQAGRTARTAIDALLGVAL